MGRDSTSNFLKYHKKLKTTLTRRLKIRKIENRTKLFKENDCFLWPIFRCPASFYCLVEERKENGERTGVQDAEVRVCCGERTLMSEAGAWGTRGRGFSKVWWDGKLKGDTAPIVALLGILWRKPFKETQVWILQVRGKEGALGMRESVQWKRKST